MAETRDVAVTSQPRALVPTTIDEVQRYAKMLCASGFFRDAGDIAQACVKVLAGAELGLPPFASMRGVHIIQGQPSIGAGNIAALVKRSGRYNYRIRQQTNAGCTLEFYEDGESVGEVSFTEADAKLAGLAGKDNYKKHPSDMMFARAISRGARRFCPDIFGGSVYVPGELPGSPEPAEFDEVPENGSGDPQPRAVDAEVEDAEPSAPAKPTDAETAPALDFEALMEGAIAGHKPGAVLDATYHFAMGETTGHAMIGQDVDAVMYRKAAHHRIGGAASALKRAGKDEGDLSQYPDDIRMLQILVAYSDALKRIDAELAK